MDAAIAKLLSESISSQNGGGAKGSINGGGSDFNKVLEQTTQSDASRIKAISSGEIPVNPHLVEAGKKTDLLHLLGDVNRSGLQIDSMIEMVTNNHAMSAQNLLAAQAAVSYSVLEVDFAGQIAGSADRARNSLLNIQV